MKRVIAVFIALLLCALCAVPAAAASECVFWCFTKDGAMESFLLPACPEGVSCVYEAAHRKCTVYIDGDAFPYAALRMSVWEDVRVDMRITGTLRLTPVKITSGNSYYAALACNEPLHLYPGEADASLLITGVADAPDAPYYAFYTKELLVMADETLPDARLCIDTSFTVHGDGALRSPAGVANNVMRVYGADFRCSVKTDVPLYNQTVLSLYGTARFFAGYEGAGPAAESGALFSRAVYDVNFAGAAYYESTRGSALDPGGEHLIFTRVYQTACAQAGGTRYEAFLSGTQALPGQPPLRLTPVDPAQLGALLNAEGFSPYNHAETLKTGLTGPGFAAEVRWLDPDGNDVSGSPARAEAAYQALLRLCPTSGYTLPAFDRDALQAILPASAAAIRTVPAAGPNGCPEILITFTPEGFVPGDVDCDGAVGTADARLALRKAIGLESYAENSRAFRAADADGNGAVDTADARLILRRAIGLTDPEIR